MAAELLRRAAKEMWQRAEAATPGRWGVHVYPVLSGHWAVYSESRTVPGSRLANCGKDEGAAADAEHMAAWDPAVALAVADLLDKWAWMVELDADMHNRVGGEQIEAIARAYLGEEAAS